MDTDTITLSTAFPASIRISAGSLWQWDAYILPALTPILMPHTQHEARQQRDEVEQEPPQRHHQARRAGARVWKKQSNLQHFCHSRSFSIEFKDNYN